jgi:hypothetical protein
MDGLSKLKLGLPELGALDSAASLSDASSDSAVGLCNGLSLIMIRKTRNASSASVKKEKKYLGVLDLQFWARCF